MTNRLLISELPWSSSGPDVNVQGSDTVQHHRRHRLVIVMIGHCQGVWAMGMAKHPLASLCIQANKGLLFN